MATAPLNAERRLVASENDECRGAALVAHLEALLGRPEAAPSEASPKA